MDIRFDQLEFDCFYHIFNRGVNGEKIFLNDENYHFFLQKVKEYLLPVVNVYAYCLMPNHFHFVLRIKSEREVKSFSETVKTKSIKIIDSGLHSEKSIVSKQVGKLMSSYTQAFNKYHHRHGNLFERPFKRKRIESEEYLQRVILYVHQNSWAIERRLEDYHYSSYKSIISDLKTNVERIEIIELFDNIENFIYCHQFEVDL